MGGPVSEQPRGFSVVEVVRLGRGYRLPRQKT